VGKPLINRSEKMKRIQKDVPRCVQAQKCFRADPKEKGKLPPKRMVTVVSEIGEYWQWDCESA